MEGERAFGCHVDWCGDELHRKTKAELLDLYHWWKEVYLPWWKSCYGEERWWAYSWDDEGFEEVLRREEEMEEELDRRLHRLIEHRRFLWT